MDASVEKIHAVQMWAISSEEDNENSNYKVIAMKQGNKGMRHKIHALEGSNVMQELHLFNYENSGESTAVTVQSASIATAGYCSICYCRLLSPVRGKYF